MNKNKSKQQKNSRLIIRINEKEKLEFINMCKKLDTSAAREIRHFIRRFIAEQTKSK